MESFKFKVIANEQGNVTALNISGLLVLENIQIIDKEIIGLVSRLSDSIKITIFDVDEIDLSFIQLIVAFFHQLIELEVNYQLQWSLNEDQYSLFENVGLSNELFMHK